MSTRSLRTLFPSFLLPALLVAACADKGEETIDSAPPLQTGDDTATVTCEGTPPVVTEVTCENTGLQPHFETGADTPTLLIMANVTDADGDLDYYAIQLFYDDVVDGAVDTSSSTFSPSNGALGGDPCESPSANLGLTLYLTGGDPAWDTEYEWGMVISDGASLESEPGIVVCCTPTSDGEDGCAGTGR